MRLVLQLIARLLVIVAVCLGAATVWATFDAYRSVDRATSASAKRVSQALRRCTGRNSCCAAAERANICLPVPEWRTTRDHEADFARRLRRVLNRKLAFEKPLCGQSKGLGEPPPAWFATTVQTLLGDHAAVAQPISTRTTTAGTVSATADPDAAIELAWQHIQDNIERRAADGAGDRLSSPRSRSRTRWRRRDRSSSRCSAWPAGNTAPCCRASVRWNLR